MKSILFLMLTMIFFTACSVDSGSSSSELVSQEVDSENSDNLSGGISSPTVPSDSSGDVDDTPTNTDTGSGTPSDTGSDTTDTSSGGTTDTGTVTNDYVTESQGNDVPMIPQGLLDSLGN